jgi:quinolinate synthase
MLRECVTHIRHSAVAIVCECVDHMNSLEKLLSVLQTGENEIKIDKNTSQQAQHSIQKLLESCHHA